MGGRLPHFCSCLSFLDFFLLSLFPRKSDSDVRFSLEGVDAVQDFLLANDEEGSSMSSERDNHLCGLMQMGNEAFRDCRFDQAIEFYSRANSIKQGDSIILSNRCRAYLWISHFFKNRPPSASDCSPLSGLDPTMHAGLALSDAEKVMKLQSNSVTSYILKANALILSCYYDPRKGSFGIIKLCSLASLKFTLAYLCVFYVVQLEKYEQAANVIRSGFQIDPYSTPLQNLERTTANLFFRRPYLKPQQNDDYDCTLCLKLLYEPTTTSCGHSFCNSCLFQSVDRGNRCPLCRTVLFVTPRTVSISVTLSNIIQKSFPEEYDERKSEHKKLTDLGADLLPLFVMDAILPCQKLQLNIFEPRYRLMVRRLMEGNRHMGMVAFDSNTCSISDYACEVEITDCEPLPDGRFYLEVESRRRCCIIRNWDQDGYRVAEVEWVRDDFQAEGSTERNDLLEMAYNAADFAQRWINDARDAAQGDNKMLADLSKAEALKPPTHDPELFSFWLATLTKMGPSERLDLLRLRDTKERIRQGLLHMKREEQICRMQ